MYLKNLLKKKHKTIEPFIDLFYDTKGLPRWLSIVKNPLAVAGDAVLILGLEDPRRRKW